MDSYIVCAVAGNLALRAFAIDSTAIVERRVKYTKPSRLPPPRWAGALGNLHHGILLKGEKDSITFQMRGDGPLGSIVCVSDSLGTCAAIFRIGGRAAAEPRGEARRGRGVGKGTLTVIRDLNLKEPYIGRTDIVSGEIAEDSPIISPVRSRSHRLRAGRAGGHGPAYQGGRRLSDPAHALYGGERGRRLLEKCVFRAPRYRG